MKQRNKRTIKVHTCCYLLILIIAVGCQHASNEVVVYNTVDQIYSEPILREFEQQTGIKVRAVFDTEETKSTGILNRIIAEKDHPQCDVFWSGDPVRTVVLKKKGLLQKITLANAAGIPAHFIDPEGYWVGFSARARVLLYNTELVEYDSLPHSILDLATEKFKGQAAIANPLFGTTTFHMAALFMQMGDEGAKKFLDELQANEIILASSNGDIKRRIARGELKMGLSDTDDGLSAIMAGDPVSMTFLDQEGFGSLIMPNTVSQIKGSPNVENAQKLMEYLVSKETELKLARSCGQMPLHSGVEVPEHTPSIDKIKAMRIDYTATADKLESIQPFLKQWIEN